MGPELTQKQPVIVSTMKLNCLESTVIGSIFCCFVVINNIIILLLNQSVDVIG